MVAITTTAQSKPVGGLKIGKIGIYLIVCKVMRIYKFSETTKDWTEMANCDLVKLSERVAAGVPLTREEKNRITQGGIFSGGVIHLYGWAFDFRADLKRYLVRLSGYGWQEYRSFDKTAIRACLSGVLEIVEVK